MRILLVYPPFVGWLNDIKVEPIGLLYIAACLCRAGHDVELYDPYIGDTEASFLDKLAHFRPRIVGCAVYTVSEQFCFDLARVTRQVDPTILFVAGGPHATFTAGRMLSRCDAIDVIAHRESKASCPSWAGRRMPSRTPVSSRPRLFIAAAAQPRGRPNSDGAS
jgi:hypothetical protein